MKKPLSFTFLLLALSCAAHAQYIKFYLYTGDHDYTGVIGNLQSAPAFGYTAWGTPIPPIFFLFSDTKYWRWTSTCASGGDYSEINQMNPEMTQISVGAAIFNPFTSMAQGLFSGIEVVEWIGIGYLPVWQQGINMGYPCGPTSSGAREVQNQQVITETQ